MFKQFTPENQNTYEYKAHKSFTLSQADVTRHQFLNNSSNEVSISYYDFARINFYLSGSTDEKYSEQFNIGNDGSGRDTFLTKFYDTGSIVFIPQNKFDEEIKRGSFQLIDVETGALVVDDINDSGHTLSMISEFFKQRHIRASYAVLQNKTSSNFTVDYWGTLQDNDNWINFPWETK